VQRTIGCQQASFPEELRAADWYQPSPEGCEKAELKEIFREEIERASMAPEWLRRNSVEFDTNLRTYLSCDGNILQLEKGQP
jgi:hypothetical protein